MLSSGAGPAAPPPDPRGRARRRAIGAAGALMVLFLLNGIWIARSVLGLGREAPLEGERAPGFHAPRLGGGALDLDSLRGQVVLVDFFATWCTPCVAELPTLGRLAESLGPRGLAVVGVDIEGPAAARAVRDLIDEAGVRFPVVLDDGVVRERYRVKTLPHRVLIDRRGVVRRTLLGATPEEELRRALEDALR
jgi:thiol-disulfide isomerase/thioredoxin